MTHKEIIEAQVRDFAHVEAAAVFAIWDADGDFMARRAEALAAINAFAADRAEPGDSRRTTFLQGIGFNAYCEHHSELMEQWDAALAREAEAQERAGGARRRRQHHVRSVYR